VESAAALSFRKETATIIPRKATATWLKVKLQFVDRDDAVTIPPRRTTASCLKLQSADRIDAATMIPKRATTTTWPKV
jgi:hypothetical protein